jgi:uncharacterized protein
MRNVMMTALIAMAPAGAMAQAVDSTPIVPDGTLLDVVAEGRTTRVPDVATIRAGVVTQGAAAAAALQDNADRMSRVIAALKSAGIAERDVATARVALTPQYRYADNQPPVITGYQASNSVSVRFHDIGKSGAILDTLVKQGANQIDGPDLSLADADTALDEARVDAVKRARARAALYANAAGLSVVRIVSISEGGDNAGPRPPVPVVYAMRAKAASTTIAPGETDVTATINVRFLLK